jgi:NDP-sugar pyrophosphorylase family protein
VSPIPLDIPVAILAGGLATRMRPLTETIPKSLLPVAGRPFLAHQLDLLKSRGIQQAVLCVGHLGDRIEQEFGDGTAAGIRLRYSFDGPVLRGTGGAIRRALPLLGDRFFVLYGDSYLPIEFHPVARTFEQSGRRGLMTVYRNAGRFDTSNVRFEQGEILVYDKSKRDPSLHHIDYGLSLFQASVFADYPESEPFDLAAVMKDLVAAKQLAGYEVASRFYEIGSPEGLRELDQRLQSTSPHS